MKKVKTILASLMIILATAVMSACSCSGSSDDDGGPQISVTAISITSDFSKATRDDETGYLTIKCSRNEEFDITYNLSPDNTTRTQVDWTFEGNDSVVVTKGNYYTYSNTATHTITFKATKVGNTVIKFKPKNTDKWTQATVTVGEAEAVWPSFVAPSGLDYNPSTGKIVWNAVSQMKTYTGEIQNVSTSNGIIGGLSGYIVKYKNLTTGEEYTTPTDQPIANREFELPRGYTYEVSVGVRGDDFSVKDSPMSEAIRIHQLSTVTNLTNNNGLISFSTPEYSELNEVYYLASDTKECITRTSDGAQDISFICRDGNNKLFKDASRYDISVISYPKGWATAKTEGKNYVFDNATQARFYPSVASETLVVQNLPSPTITFGHKQGLVTINGSTFGEEGSSSNPYTSSIISWVTGNTYEDEYGVTYYYTVTNNTSGNVWTTVSSGTGKSFDTSNISSPNTNQYMLTVWTEGNANNTIKSPESTLIFYMPQVINYGDTTSSISSTTLTTSESSTYIKGVDLYFVDLDNNGKENFYYFVEANNDGATTDKSVSINISQLDGLKPGKWDIYGRFVGFTYKDDRNVYYSGVGPYSKINENKVVVSPAVENAKVSISSTGLVSFDCVEVVDNLSTTQTIKEYFITISQGNTSFVYDTSIQDGNKIEVNLYDIIGEKISEGVIKESFEEFTAAGKTISFSIVTAGIEGDGVNSYPSSVFSITRNAKVSSTVEISENGNGQKILKFKSSCDTGYTIQIGNYQYKTEASYSEGADVSINLEEKDLIKYVNTEGSTDITIWANGSSNKTSGSGTSATADSLPVTVTIECTEAVTDVEIDENGLLKWDINNINEYSDEQKFIITLTGKMGGEEQTKTLKVSVSREALQSAENAEEEGESSTTQFGKYYCNIFDEISKFDSEKTISITIAHIVANKFTHKASNPYYIKQLASSEIGKGESEGSPIIQFQAKKGIYYYLYVGDTNVSTIKLEDKDDTIKKQVNEILDSGLQAGTYQIKLIASMLKGDRNGDNDGNKNNDGSENSPFIINSKQTNIEIIVVKKGIAVSPNGEYVEWSQLHPEATYTLQYKKSGEDGWTTVQDGGVDKVFDNNTLKYNVSDIFESGSCQFRVIPNINYMDNSVVLLGEIKEDNTITRLSAVTLSTDGNGKLTYSEIVDKDGNNQTVDYNIVVYVGDKILSSDEYSLNKTDRKIEILSSNYIGEKDYKIKIVASGYISSPLSDVCSATKLATVTNLSKSGDWLIFSTVEGADVYQITFTNDQGGNYSTIIKLSGDDAIQFSGTNQENGSDWINAQDSEAKVVNGQIWLNYKANKLGFETNEAGKYYYCVTAQTKTTGYLNGNMSSKYEIIKLSEDVGISTSGESFILSGYQYSDDELETPISIDYTITYIENVSNTYEKGSGWADIVWYFDPTQFNSDILEYELKFSKSNDETVTNEIVKLRLTPNGTNTPKLEMSTMEGDEEVFVQKDYVTSYNDQYKITFPASEIEKVTFSNDESTEYADSITLSYIRQLDVCSQTVPFLSAIGEDGEFNYTINLNTLGLYDEGSYSLKVRFVGNDNNILSSKIKESSEPVTKLASNTLFTEEGVLSWSANTVATDYTIRITTDSTSEGIAVQSEEDLGEEGQEEGQEEGDGEGETSNPTLNNEWFFVGYKYTGTNESTYNISEADLKTLNSQFTGFEVGKTYYVQIMANADGCLSSKWSDIFEVEKLKAPNNVTVTSTGKTIIKEDSQGNVITTEIGSPMLKWQDSNNTANRLNYIYKIGDDENKVVNMTDEGMTWSGQLLPTDLIKGNYDVAVKVVGNTTTGTNQKGLLTSDYSTQNPTLKYVDESTAVGFGSNQTTRDNFSWNEVEGAYAYKLSFYRGSISTSQEFAEETPIYTTYTSEKNYKFTSSEFAGSGYFTVLVSAITDPTKAIVSTYVGADESFESEKVLTNCASLYRANSVEELMVYDGLLAWTVDVNDMKEYLLSSTETKNKLIELFKGDKETISDEELISNVYNFIQSKINNKSSNNLDNQNKDSILSHLLTFKANINGVETVITPSVVDAVKVEVDGTYSIVNIESAQYLLYKFSMDTEPSSEVSSQSSENTLETVINSTTKYTIKVAPQGNYSTSNSTVDGKYVSSITAYKPKTPRAVLIDDGDNERKQISDGDLWWSLVTTEDSTLEEEGMKFHETYTIQVVNNNGDKVTDKTIDINNTVVEGNNLNLRDKSNYYRNLKALFEEEILTNTVYKVRINVAGTPDSTKLADGEKAYFNSNTFEYRDVLNILENQNQSVTNGEYSYTPCDSMSTQTDVYVYGPFLDDDDNPIYAPDASDDSTWEWTDVSIDGTKYTVSATSYKEAVTAWKKLIEPIWNQAKKHGWTTLLNKYTFAEESSSEGDSFASTSRTKTMNLTTLLDNNGERFGKGSYIIRKQEIGNGRGIIDTDYSENLIDYSTGEDPQPLDLNYEQIATKLGKTSTVITSGDTKNDCGVWLEDGKFVWKKVERANAYKIIIEKLALVGGVLSDNPSMTEEATVKATELEKQYYEMLENMSFNDKDGTYKYRIVITATHLETDEVTITDNYFAGDEVTTDAYYRAPYLDDFSISENGIISWNENFENSQIRGFEIMVNQNSEGTTTVETKNKYYDLSSVVSSAFDFSVRALGVCSGNDRYINSCYTAAIHIVKIADPTIKVVKGNVEWGTETSDNVNNQITNTIFTLKKKQGTDYVAIEDLEKIELDAIYGNYPLFSEITGYNEEYLLSGEKFETTDYQYVVKYKGSESGKVSFDQTYVIASGESSLNVTKLPSPELKYIDVITNNNSDNRVNWEKIANASGYRALVITDSNKIFDITQTFKDVVIDGKTQTQYSTQITIKNGDTVEKTLDDTNVTYNYFYYDNTLGTNGSVQLSISEVINTMNLSAEDGLSLKVYVQPIGTLDSTEITADQDNLFISGSFSDVQTIEIPAAPKNASFNEATGELSWTIGSEDSSEKDKGHNVRITMGYKVNDVEKDELDNYWKYTSDTYTEGQISTTVENASANRKAIKCSADIINRTIVITSNVNGKYSIEVTDIVFLSAENRVTPTSYRVTNTGDSYNFAIRVLVGADDNGTLYSGIYMSNEAKLNSTASKSYSFHIFASGDGSTLLPYEVETYTMFDAIRYYPNANFEITQDISFKDVNNQIVSWNMIESFTGTISGNGYTISNIKPNVMTATRKVNNKDEEMLYSALIVENSGTIKDLNISINNVYGGNPGARTVWASGFVISNTGIIQNVHIQTFSDGSGRYIHIVPSDNLYNTMVAGLAIENSGTISGSSVTSDSIYSLDNSTYSTYVAGFVCTNTGTIDASYFSGNITGNIVGGVVITNNGTISNSYAKGTAMITDTSYNSTTLDVSKGLGVGGIAYEIGEGSTIDSCYSLLEIIVDIRTTASANLAHIGGLVAMVKSKNATIKNCYVVYQAYNIGTANASAYAFAPEVNTKENNFYIVKVKEYEEDGETKTRENIAINSSNVATEKTLDELCTAMVAIKDENGETVYTMTITTTDDQGEENEITYDHPVLIKNPEIK